jgi:hypothetical protein
LSHKIFAPQNCFIRSIFCVLQILKAIIGDSSKDFNQIKGIPSSYLALDIQNGSGYKIPVWMFGMMS